MRLPLVIVVEIKGDDRGVMGAGVAAMRRGHRLCDSRDVRWAAITQCVEATRGEIVEQSLRDGGRLAHVPEKLGALVEGPAGAVAPR